MGHPRAIAARFIAGLLAPSGTLDAALSAAGVGGAHEDVIPVGTSWGVGATPHRVTYGEQAPGADAYVIGQRRLTTDPLFQVVAVGRVASAESLEDAADRIDALLHEASGAVDGGEVLACTRERPLSLGPIYGPGGIATYKLGGLYRLIVREEE